MTEQDKTLNELVVTRDTIGEEKGYDCSECKDYSERIHKYIVDNRDALLIESIFESLSSLGGCPTLLYDDNGHFAVGSSGGQSVDLDFDSKTNEDSAHFEGFWLLKKKNWKKTIREAVNEYLTRLE